MYILAYSKKHTIFCERKVEEKFIHLENADKILFQTQKVAYIYLQSTNTSKLRLQNIAHKVMGGGLHGVLEHFDIIVIVVAVLYCLFSLSILTARYSLFG